MARPETEQATQATRVTADEVRERLRSGEALIFVDTRNPQAWKAAQTKMPDAIRVPAENAEAYLAEIPRDRTIITYCT